MFTRLATTLAVLSLLAPAAGSAWTWPATGEVIRGFDYGGGAYTASARRGIHIAGGAGAVFRAPISAGGAPRPRGAVWPPGAPPRRACPPRRLPPRRRRRCPLRTQRPRLSSPRRPSQRLRARPGAERRLPERRRRWRHDRRSPDAPPPGRVPRP